MVEKIIVRKGVLSEPALNSKLIGLASGNEDIETIDQLRIRLGDREIFRFVFGEELDADKWEDSSLYSKYNEILETGKDNEFFQKLYRISKNFAVSIEAHTLLYHIHDISYYIDETREDILLPWFIICSISDIADTWWETAEEILNDMEHLPLIKYVEKYRMFR
jgi:hypothetical protein